MDVIANAQIEEFKYKTAGVDVETAKQLVEDIKPIASQLRRPEVLTGFSGFGSLMELPSKNFKQPVLVSSTAGIGTKLRLAIDLQKFDTIGIDLVAKCVNDLIVLGAEPLYFLDCFTTGKLNLNIAKKVVENIGVGCAQANISLVGGETTQMPSMYQQGDFNLAGFAVGVVEKNNIIDAKNLQPSDVIIGVASSGVHSNGFSMIQKILEFSEADLSMNLGRNSLGNLLLTPTRIYVKAVSALLEKIHVKAMAHITENGLTENISQFLPQNIQAKIKTKSWRWPVIFDWIKNQGAIENFQMYNHFNCGVGLCVVVSEPDLKETLSILNNCDEKAFIMGKITERTNTAEQSVIFS